MNNIVQYLSESAEDSAQFMRQMLLTFAAIFIAWAISGLIHWLFPKIIFSEKITRRLYQFFRVILIIAVVAFTFNLWFSHVQSMGLIVTLVLALVALALKDMIVDLVAYIYVAIRHPFRVGDLIMVDGIKGEVVDMDFFQFNLAEMGDLVDTLTPTGRYVSLPNRFIFEKALYNYSHTNPFVMADVFILIDFDADRQEALRLAGQIAYEKHLEILERYEEEELELFDREMEAQDSDKKPTIRATLDANGFRVYIQFFTMYRDIGQTKMIMQNALYDAFVAHGIEMPVPNYLRLD